MLVLHADQVTFCQVTHREGEAVSKLQGFTYLGRLFIKAESFAHEQRQQALLRTQELLDMDQEFLPVMVEEASGISLWYCSGKVKVDANGKTPPQSEATAEFVHEDNQSETETDQHEEKDDSKTFSKSLLNRLRKEWEDSFRLTS